MILKLFLLLFAFGVNAQPTLLSWNLQNLGESKSDSTLRFIASQIKDYHIVAPAPRSLLNAPLLFEVSRLRSKYTPRSSKSPDSQLHEVCLFPHRSSTVSRPRSKLIISNELIGYPRCSMYFLLLL